MKLALTSTLALFLFGTASAFALSDADREAAIKAADLGDLIKCGEELNQPITFDTEVMNLDNDGPEELMITLRARDGGTSCLSHIGKKQILMIKNRRGEWIDNLGFDAEALKFLPDRSVGFPDIEVDALNECRPIWRFNGTRYHIYKQCRNGKHVIATSWTAGGNLPERMEDSLSWDSDRIYLHNGSGMYVNFGTGEIRYSSPKDSIAKTVQDGTVLFRGEFKNAPGQKLRGTVSGTAYVFKKGCEPAPYPVSGTYNDDTVTLKGAAPKRAKDSCAVLETTRNSPHATLKFEVPPWD